MAIQNKTYELEELMERTVFTDETPSKLCILDYESSPNEYFATISSFRI
jgi:hypothetical protein